MSRIFSKNKSKVLLLEDGVREGTEICNRINQIKEELKRRDLNIELSESYNDLNDIITIDKNIDCLLISWPDNKNECNILETIKQLNKSQPGVPVFLLTHKKDALEKISREVYENIEEIIWKCSCLFSRSHLQLLVPPDPQADLALRPLAPPSLALLHASQRELLDCETVWDGFCLSRKHLLSGSLSSCGRSYVSCRIALSLWSPLWNNLALRGDWTNLTGWFPPPGTPTSDPRESLVLAAWRPPPTTRSGPGTGPRWAGRWGWTGWWWGAGGAWPAPSGSPRWGSSGRAPWPAASGEGGG